MLSRRFLLSSFPFVLFVFIGGCDAAQDIVVMDGDDDVAVDAITTEVLLEQTDYNIVSEAAITSSQKKPQQEQHVIHAHPNV